MSATPRGGRGCDPTLRQPPLRLCQRRALLGDHGALRRDLVLPSGGLLDLLQLRLGRLDVGDGGIQVGRLLVYRLLRRGTAPQQFPIAGEIPGDAVPGGAHIHEIGLGLGDLCLAARLFQIGQSVLRLGEGGGRLVARGEIVGIVLGEQRRPGRDTFAAMHRHS